MLQNFTLIEGLNFKLAQPGPRQPAIVAHVFACLAAGLSRNGHFFLVEWSFLTLSDFLSLCLPVLSFLLCFPFGEEGTDSSNTDSSFAFITFDDEAASDDCIGLFPNANLDGLAVETGLFPGAGLCPALASAFLFFTGVAGADCWDMSKNPVDSSKFWSTSEMSSFVGLGSAHWSSLVAPVLSLAGGLEITWPLPKKCQVKTWNFNYTRLLFDIIFKKKTDFCFTKTSRHTWSSGEAGTTSRCAFHNQSTTFFKASSSDMPFFLPCQKAEWLNCRCGSP